MGVDMDSDECGNLDDTSHSRYKKVSGGNGSTYYLFRDGSEWRFQKTDCTDSPYFNSRGTFEAGDEPFLDAEDTVGCYDGGYGSDRRYTYTDLSMECQKFADESSYNIFGSSGASCKKGNRGTTNILVAIV